MIYFESLVYSIKTRHISILKSPLAISSFFPDSSTMNNDDINNLLRSFQEEPPFLEQPRNGLAIHLLNLEGKFVIHLIINLDTAELFLTTIRYCKR